MVDCSNQITIMSLSRLVPAQQRLGTHQLLNYSPVHSCHRQSPLAQPISAFQQTTNTPPPTQTAQQALSVALLGSLWVGFLSSELDLQPCSSCCVHAVAGTTQMTVSFVGRPDCSSWVAQQHPHMPASSGEPPW